MNLFPTPATPSLPVDGLFGLWRLMTLMTLMRLMGLMGLMGLISLIQPAHAETPLQVRDIVTATASGGVRSGSHGMAAPQAFSAERGRTLFTTPASTWSCASCHTDNPRQTGKHAKTARAIEPLAPVANPQRLTDAAKVEKWLRRNCNDVLSRECTAQEKGDVLTWLISLQ